MLSWLQVCMSWLQICMARSKPRMQQCVSIPIKLTSCNCVTEAMPAWAQPSEALEDGIRQLSAWRALVRSPAFASAPSHSPAPPALAHARGCIAACAPPQCWEHTDCMQVLQTVLWQGLRPKWKANQSNTHAQVSPVVLGTQHLPDPLQEGARPLLFVGNHTRFGLYDLPLLVRCRFW